MYEVLRAIPFIETERRRVAASSRALEGVEWLFDGDRVRDDDEVLGTLVVMGAQPCERMCSLPLNYKVA